MLNAAYEMRISDWSSSVFSSDLTDGIAPARQCEHLGLVQVLDRRVSATHVAIDRCVTDRVLALVAGRQQQAAELVGHRHQQCATGARLQVFLGRVHRLAFERVGKRVEETLERQKSEEHTSELQSLMRSSYAVFCLTKKTIKTIHTKHKKIYKYT